MPPEPARSAVRPRLGPTLRTNRDLTDSQRWLVQIMSEFQFGRIENLPVHAGQPVLDPGVRVVRVARLGGDGDGTSASTTDEFELKQPVRDLFEELERLGDGVVLRVEFRHGLPCLLEMTAATQPLESHALVAVIERIR
jgi:hypothetical protein